MQKLISFLSDKIVFYRWLNGQRPPVYVIENFVSLAYCLKTTFDCVTEKDREEMFKYFEQWSNLKPIDFDNAIQDVLKIDYNQFTSTRVALLSKEKELCQRLQKMN